MNFNDIPQDELAESLRTPPNSIESESSVLGGILMDNRLFDIVADLLESDDFYRREHALIFEAAKAMLSASKPADVITVFEHFRNIGKAEEIGGLEYLNSLAQYTPSAHNLRRHAEIVSDKSTLRKLLQASFDINEAVFRADGTSVPERVNESVQSVQSLQVGKGQHEPVAVENCMVSFIENLQELASGRRAPGIKTGFSDIDRMMNGGFKPGKMICIAARPSVGKTSLTLQILRNIAQNGDATAFLSQEMMTDELSNRLVASAGRADYGQIESGTPDNETWERVVQGVEALRGVPLYLDDQSSLTLSDIQSKARRLRAKHGIKVLAIDYLQLCKTSSKHDNRATAIGEISRGLKALGMQLGITVVILSQLNRDVEKRTSGKPMMADLKESGDIEQDCDTIMMLSEAEKFEESSLIRCDIVKNRAGRKGEVPLLFQGRFQRWEQTEYDFNKAKKSTGREL